MGFALDHLTTTDLSRIAQELLTNPHEHGGHIWAHCPWHVEDSPGGAFYYTPEKDFGYCHSCDNGGDLVNIYQAIQGMDDRTALKSFAADHCPEALRSGSQQEYRGTPRQYVKNDKQTYIPKETEDPDETWRSKAESMLAWSKTHLARNTEMLNWLQERGIDWETAKKFELGWNPGERGRDILRDRSSWGVPEKYRTEEPDKPVKLWIPKGLVIPCRKSGTLHRLRIRRFTQEGPKYYVLPGSSAVTMFLPGTGDSNLPQAAVATETELDALMLHAAVGDLVHVLGLGSSSAKPDTDSFAVLEDCASILLALDADQAGVKACSWWEEHFPQSNLWPVPWGKDPGDAAKQGLDVRSWIIAGLPPAWSYGPSDLQSSCKGQEEPVELEEQGQGDESAEVESDASRFVPESVNELSRLLASYPVRIQVSEKGVRILENPKDALRFWEQSRRISELVFQNDEVWQHLHELAWFGVTLIDSKNILGD